MALLNFLLYQGYVRPGYDYLLERRLCVVRRETSAIASSGKLSAYKPDPVMAVRKRPGGPCRELREHGSAELMAECGMFGCSYGLADARPESNG